MKSASPQPNQESNSDCTNQKRHMPDSVSESENTPLPKRQRLRSSDSIETTVLNTGSSCGKVEPLSELNSVNKICSKQDIIENNFSKSVMPPEIKNISLDSETSSEKCTSSDTNNGSCNSANIPIENINGGMSPHSATTMQIVTQLPDGCSSNLNNSNNNHEDSDDGLEDDDNYLDSDAENDLKNLVSSTNADDDEDYEDDQSVISTVTVGSTCSLRSIASDTVGSIYMNENGVAANEDGSLLYTFNPASKPLPPLTISLFSNVPPTINFCQYNELTSKLPDELSHLLRWRFSAITPVIVKKTITNSGFRIVKKSPLWIGTWGKHMKANCFKTIKEYQKVNHFPGTFQIGRKDRLWKNFALLQSKFGKEEFGFIPKTFVLPHDVNALKSAFDKEGVKKKWIIKPPASARGTGIQVVNKWNQLPLNESVVVQRYISRPYLINNTKFDIRLYVLATSFHPLRIYLYQDGLVRFASVEYKKASKTLGDRFMHLTNYSVNKESSSYTHNEDAGQCQGHKWTLKTLWAYLKSHDVDTEVLWSKIADLVIKTIISGENEIVGRTKKYTKSSYMCFEVFGFDVILDEKLRPWLLEVNISPSLHSASALDHSVKGPLIADILNLIGYHIPDKITKDTENELLSKLNLGNVESLCLDRRLYTRLLTQREQSKHIKMNSLPRSQYLSSILEEIEPDDLRNLILAEDQLKRCGKFSCIFPTCDTYQYFAFMERTRYYNRLFDAWETTYGNSREKGVSLLNELCQQHKHLQVPSNFKLPKVVTKLSEESQLRSQNSKSSNRSAETSIIYEENIKKCKTVKVVINPLKPAEVQSRPNVDLVTKARR